MKLRYLFSTILASALMLVGCTPESIDSFESIKLSQTYLSVPEAGGAVKLTINSQVDWEFATTDKWPTYKEKDSNGKEVEKNAWLSVDKMKGFAGVTEVTFTAEATESGREFELEIKAGKHSQFVRVRQGSMVAEEAKCEEVIAGPDGKTYIVQGVCTSIASDYYGNWYMNDGTGEVYIYGTVNADGDYDWESFNIEVGDSVKVEGPKTTYKETVELVNVSVIKVIKTLLKIASEPYMAETNGDLFDVKVAYKGKGVFYSVPEEYKDWVAVENMTYKPGTPTKLEPNPADTAIFKVSVKPNEGTTREASVEFTSSNNDGTSVGVYKFAQAGLASISEVRKSEVNSQVLVAGQVMAKHQSGFIVADETAAIYIYDNKAEIAVGNNVVISGTFDNYWGTLQVKNITLKSNDEATDAPAYPTAINLERQADYDAFPLYGNKEPNNNPVDYPLVKIRGKFSSSVNSKGQTEYFITVGESTKKTQLYKTLATDYSALEGKTVSATVYVMGFHSSGYYQAIEIAAPVEATGELPALTITPIKDVVASTEATYTVEGVVVAAEESAYILADATGNLMVYGKNHGRKVMEKVRLTGTASHYDGYNTNTLQLSTSVVDVLLVKSTWTYNPTLLDAAAFEAKLEKASICEEVSVVGTMAISSDLKYANINVDGSTKQAALKYVTVANYKEFDGKKVIVKGYVAGTYTRLSIVPYSVEEYVEPTL